MEIVKIGMDVGNYDAKTQNTSIPSSYKAYSSKPQMVDNLVFYDGMYYTTTKERNNQQFDKTENNYCLIVTLFGIAGEILWKIRHQHPEYTDAQIQEEISKIKEIKLGVGLPVGYFSSQSTNLVNFYMNNWGNGFEFTYGDFSFNLKLNKCVAYPQDLSAVIYNDECEIARDFPTYYVIGIGGGTVDIIPVSQGQPEIEKIITIEKGTTVMYSHIIKSMQMETGHTMEYTTIEDVLLGKNTIIDDRRKNRIGQLAAEFISKLVDDMSHAKLKLMDVPCVFVGGGALMMRPALIATNQFVKYEFIEDVNVNAKFYAAFTD